MRQNITLLVVKLLVLLGIKDKENEISNYKTWIILKFCHTLTLNNEILAK